MDRDNRRRGAAGELEVYECVGILAVFAHAGVTDGNENDLCLCVFEHPDKRGIKAVSQHCRLLLTNSSPLSWMWKYTPLLI